MKRRVLLSLPASNDLSDINDYYLTEVSDAVAARIIDRLEQAVTSLENVPDRGSVPKELLNIGIRQYRQIIQNPYRIIYEPFEKQVVVHAILDGRRDMQTLLSRRILRE